MQKTIFISVPIDEFQSMLADCVLSCLKYPPIQATKEAFLTEQQAAIYLDIPDATLQALIKKCEIPIRVKAKRCYFSQQDLERWKGNSGKEVSNG